MAQDTLLGFPAHTLPYRCGEFTTLSTASRVSFRLALNGSFRAFSFGGDTMNDKDYMRLALQLAKKGCGWTSPNPMVGAVVVKEGRIIGQGWHQRYGQAHAERNALASCTEDPQGATLYVTLEPCCHYGKQPPCVDAILGAGIHRVVVGSADPNPLVAGKVQTHPRATSTSARPYWLCAWYLLSSRLYCRLRSFTESCLAARGLYHR